MHPKQIVICLIIVSQIHLLFCNGQASDVPMDNDRSDLLLTDLQAITPVTAMDIYTVQKLDIFRAKLDAYPQDTSMDILIYSSTMSVFPSDFFQPYNVIALRLYDCSMTSLPYDLIRPICAKTLQVLEIRYNGMVSPALKLTKGGFDGCSGLLDVWLQNLVQEVPIEAFRGLDNLKGLTLQMNQIQGLDIGFEGLHDTLEYLNLDDNPISSVPLDTFKGWTKMTFLVMSNAMVKTLENGTFDSIGPSPSVILSGNPLNCTCDLQWLQDWFQQNPINQTLYSTLGFTGDPQPICATPKIEPLLTFDYETGPYKCDGTSDVTEVTEVTTVPDVTGVTTTPDLTNATEFTNSTSDPNGSQEIRSLSMITILLLTFIPHKIL